MKQDRRGVLGVIFKGNIFVAEGEQDSKSRMKTCEMCNTSTNKWRFIKSLNVPRARVMYKDKFWIDMFIN